MRIITIKSEDTYHLDDDEIIHLKNISKGRSDTLVTQTISELLEKGLIDFDDSCAETIYYLTPKGELVLKQII